MASSLQIDILPVEVTVKEAARFLGVSRRVIQQLLEFGELDATRVNGKILIDPKSLQAYRRGEKMM